MKKLLLTILFLVASSEAIAQNSKDECGKLLVDGKKAEYESCIKNILEQAEKVSKKQ